VTIAPEEEKLLKDDNSRVNRIIRGFQEWQLLCKYATSLQATHCLIMYFDPLKFPLALGAKAPCSVSGIYFRPTFHYIEFNNYVFSRQERVKLWLDKLILLRVLSNRYLKILLCLDSFVVDHINKIPSNAKAVHLPDPVKILSNSELDLDKLRESLGINPSRQVFLLFGSLRRRKGIQQLLDAIVMLTPDLGQKLCLVLLGVPHPIEEKALIEAKIAEVCQSLPVQIISNYEYIREADVYEYFHLADVVLAPYQRQVGSSGILLLAAAAQKPVLTSNYGLIGELVKRYSLGLAVDASVPSEIAKGLTQLLLKSPREFCDQSKMKSFVEQNSPEQFASVVFKHL